MTARRKFQGREFSSRAFYDSLDVIGWSGYELARRVKVHETMVRRWGRLEKKIPDEVWEKICRLADVIIALKFKGK